MTYSISLWEKGWSKFSLPIEKGGSLFIKTIFIIITHMKGRRRIFLHFKCDVLNQHVIFVNLPKVKLLISERIYLSFIFSRLPNITLFIGQYPEQKFTVYIRHIRLRNHDVVTRWQRKKRYHLSRYWVIGHVQWFLHIRSFNWKFLNSKN